MNLPVSLATSPVSAIPPTTARGALAAAAGDVDLGDYLDQQVQAGELGRFLDETGEALDLAEQNPVFAAELDPLLGRIRDALGQVPDSRLTGEERQAVDELTGRIDAHLGVDDPDGPTGPGDPVEVPGGGLEAHEQAGSHLIERHVGKNEAQLLERLRSENISASSSFRTLPDAERYVAGTIVQNQEAIDAWLDGDGGNRLVLDGRFDSSTGISVARGDEHAEDVYSVKLVLERSDKLGIGYRIVTGYPTTP